MSDLRNIRSVLVFVRDKAGRPLHGAHIYFSVDGGPKCAVDNSEGRGSIDMPKSVTNVEVFAEYRGKEQSAKISPQQDNWTFSFDVDPGGRLLDRHIPMAVGVALLLIALALAFSFQTTNALQTRLILAVSALSGGLIASEIPGFLKIDLTIGQKIAVGATGALAVLVLFYLVAPV